MDAKAILADAHSSNGADGKYKTKVRMNSDCSFERGRAVHSTRVLSTNKTLASGALPSSLVRYRRVSSKPEAANHLGARSP